MEIKWGLGRETNPNSNIKSYITYVSKLPSGNETGDFLALDLGGTNFRVLLISLNSKSTSVKIMSQKHQVRKTFRMYFRNNLFYYAAKWGGFQKILEISIGGPSLPPPPFLNGKIKNLIE